MANLGHLVYANNCDFSGGDITSSSAASNAICRELCMANISCTHITWNMVTKMCYMKKGPKAYPLSLQAYYFKGAVCGYVNHRLP